MTDRADGSLLREEIRDSRLQNAWAEINPHTGDDPVSVTMGRRFPSDRNHCQVAA
jgi:hypothetical protein